ncbi:hypothetical protein [Halocatena marina]|uniref:Uncharacterized protein n=1 Tax=Halocatena marina TaxID=2934937 RepID=A0ABD5YYL9_9EURY|nr:hypothetical protein [Halocatena marina]
MVDRRIPTRLLSGALGVLLIAQPVAAQTGLDLLQQGFCGTKFATLFAAAWGGGVVFLGIPIFDCIALGAL